MSLSTTVSHSAFIRATAGRSAELGLRLERLLEPSRHTPGCLHFSLAHSQCDDDLWLVIGFWANQPAMAAWFNSPVMQVFDGLVTDRLVNSLDFQTFTAIQAQGSLHQLAS